MLGHCTDCVSFWQRCSVVSFYFCGFYCSYLSSWPVLLPGQTTVCFYGSGFTVGGYMVCKFRSNETSTACDFYFPRL